MRHGTSDRKPPGRLDGFRRSNLGCVVSLLFLVPGFPLAVIAPSFFLMPWLNRIAINSDHGYDAHSAGVRVVRKGPLLTDGSNLLWWELFRVGGVLTMTFAAFTVWGFLYYWIFDPEQTRAVDPTSSDDKADR